LALLVVADPVVGLDELPVVPLLVSSGLLVSTPEYSATIKTFMLGVLENDQLPVALWELALAIRHIET
jgi:hypothetical protein